LNRKSFLFFIENTLLKMYTIPQNRCQELCIPRVSNEIIKKNIISTFNTLEIGKIEKITEIPNRNDMNFKSIYIKICWNNNPRTILLKNRILDGKDFKIVYDYPWNYWIVVSSNIRHE